MVKIDRRFPGFVDTHPLGAETPQRNFPVANQDGPIEEGQGQMLLNERHPAGYGPEREARVRKALEGHTIGTPQQHERLVDRVARTTVPVEHLEGVTWDMTRGGARGGFYSRGGVPTLHNDGTQTRPGTIGIKGGMNPRTIAHEVGHHVDLGLNPEHAAKRFDQSYPDQLDYDTHYKKLTTPGNRWSYDDDTNRHEAEERAGRREEYKQSIRVGQNEGAADAYGTIHQGEGQGVHEYSPHNLGMNIRNNSTRTWGGQWGTRRHTETIGSSNTKVGRELAEDVYLSERARFGQLPGRMEEPSYYTKSRGHSWFDAVQRNTPQPEAPEQGKLFESGDVYHPLYQVTAQYARGAQVVHVGSDYRAAHEAAAKHVNAGRNVDLHYTEKQTDTTHDIDWQHLADFSARRKGAPMVTGRDLDR